MAAEPDYLLDGNYAISNPVGAARWEWPFRSNGDRVSAFFEQDFWQTFNTYTPQEIGTLWRPGSDFYFVRESPLAPVEPVANVLAQFTRMISRIPATQVTYSSATLSKPTVPNEAASTISLRAYQASTVEIATALRNNTGWWSSDDRVFASFVSFSATTSATSATAGTYTLTYKTSTTAALAYNANVATISAALNGLASSIADGITWSAANPLDGNGFVQLDISVGTTSTAVTMNPASLTLSPVTGNAAFTRVSLSTGIAAQYVSLARVLSVTGHGCVTAAGRSLLLVSTALSEGYVLPEGTWSVYDANTLQLTNIFTTGITADNYGTLTSVAPLLRTYTAGAVNLSARITQRFYLPGVTSGITTPADIPVTSPAVSDQDIIAAVLASGTYQAVGFEGPEKWMDSAIYTTITTEINFDQL